jgi:hypothetical protein
MAHVRGHVESRCKKEDHSMSFGSGYIDTNAIDRVVSAVFWKGLEPKYVVIDGSRHPNYRYYGPFEDAEAARDWRERNIDHVDTWHAVIHLPATESLSNPDEAYVLVVGNPISGFRFVGPFNDDALRGGGVAYEWKNDYLGFDCNEWWSERLIPPDRKAAEEFVEGRCPNISDDDKAKIVGQIDAIVYAATYVE